MICNSLYSLMQPTFEGSEILTFTPSYSELSITNTSIERGLGYREAKISPSASALIQDILPDISRYIDLECGCMILPVHSVMMDHDFTLCGGHRLHLGSMIAERLRDATTIALFVATIGPRLERWASSLMKGDEVMKGYIVDTIGSEAAEQTAEWVERKVAEAALARGWNVTNRYSPGYCGWPTSDQHTLFSLLPEGFCGIRLTESALMVPIKSVSGVIGLGPDVRREGYQCAICEMEDCFRRRTEE
jgi:hypothetical protein